MENGLASYSQIINDIKDLIHRHQYEAMIKTQLRVDTTLLGDWQGD